MATQENLELAQQLYVAYYGRPADEAGLEFWAEEIEASGVDSVVSAFGNSDEYTARFGDLSDEELVNGIYQQAFNRDADEEGLAFYVEKLESGELGLASIALTIVQNATDADEPDASALATKVAAADLYTEAAGDAHSGTQADDYSAEFLADIGADTDLDTLDIASVVAGIPEPQEPTDPGVPGEVFSLTAETDRIEGTENDDQFEAYLSQNPMAGGVSNTLSSADRIDGGAGTDSMHAEIVPEFFGASGVQLMDIQPRTTSVENISLEARDGLIGDGLPDGSAITLDAKNMAGVVNIGSKQSDGDLVIENLTTLDNDGNARNTEDMTITMDHTDNFNSDGDASDLTVYFDEDYLLSGQSSTVSQANYWLLDEDSQDYENEPLLNIERNGVSLTIAGEPVTIEMDSEVAAAADTWEAFAAALQSRIDEMVANGDTTVEGITVEVDENNLDSTFNDFGDEVFIPAITLIDAQSRDLVPTGFVSPEDATGAFDIYGAFDNVASEQTQNPVTVNADLHKVGREGEGGNLLIGGKELDLNTPELTTEGEGIEVFNIDVLGAADKLSNVGYIGTTNQSLDEVNIETDADYVDGDSFASLTVRDGFGTSTGGQQDELLSLVNANDFLGDLSVGTDQRIDNVVEFTATGGGDVVYNADYSTTQNHTITTGGGDDVINVLLNGISGSGSNVTRADIVSTGGDNIISLDSFDDAQNTATVETGSGVDIVTGGAVSITSDTGSGNDVTYVDNTGLKGSASVATDNLRQADANGTPSYSFLYGRTVTVTVDGDQGINNALAEAFESGFEGQAVVGASDNARLTSRADLNAAVLEAVNDSEVLTDLVEVELDSNDNLVFTSLIDGNNISVDISVGESDWTDGDVETLLEEYRAANGDSELEIDDSYGEVSLAQAQLLQGGDSTAENNNTVSLGAGNDTVVLSTDASANDTLVINQSFGTAHVVNFTVGEDSLDFSEYLDGMRSPSASDDSRVVIDTVSQTDNELQANEINTKTFVGNDDVETFADLSASNLLDVFDYTTQQYTNTENNVQLVDGDGSSIVMVQNDENAGEYKVFNVSFDGTAEDFELSAGDIQELGTLDFGADMSDSVNDGEPTPEPTPDPSDAVVMQPGLTYDADGDDFTFQFAEERPMQSAIDNFAAGDVLQFESADVDAAGGVSVEFFNGDLDVYTDDFQLLATLNDVPAELAVNGVTLEDTVSVFGSDWLQDEDGNSLIDVAPVDTNPVVTNNDVLDAAGEDFTFDVTANNALSFELQNFSAGDQIDVSDDAMAAGLNASVANVNGDTFELFLNDDQFEYVYSIEFTEADLGGVALDEADVQGSLDAAWGDWLV